MKTLAEVMIQLANTMGKEVPDRPIEDLFELVFQYQFKDGDEYRIAISIVKCEGHNESSNN